MRTLFIAIVLFVIAAPSVAAQEATNIQWKSWSELETALEEDPRPVFIFFHAKWCGYCKKMQRKAFTNPEVVRLINANYYALEMDVESTEKIFFDQQWFENKNAKISRNGVHELPLILASREGREFSLPASLVLESDFSVKTRGFEYLTSSALIEILKE